MKKKQLPLRISPELYDKLAAWAESDFRSINGQVEYLLTLCVRQYEKTGRPIPRTFRSTGEEGGTGKENPIKLADE